MKLSKDQIKLLKSEISERLKKPTVYVWRTSQEHDLEETPFLAQLECSNVKTMKNLEELMVSKGWKETGGSFDSSDIKIFSRNWKSDKDVQRWALEFPEKVLYLNNQGKEVKWNKKGKVGRPKKNK